ncbi:unnamed protein product [Amoebophrya sp. A25]|nr:unnamed protein product [Amoebophrya sp. A25]|eukprot:GSA25T00007771001.1
MSRTPPASWQGHQIATAGTAKGAAGTTKGVSGGGTYHQGKASLQTFSNKASGSGSGKSGAGGGSQHLVGGTPGSSKRRIGSFRAGGDYATYNAGPVHRDQRHYSNSPGAILAQVRGAGAVPAFSSSRGGGKTSQKGTPQVQLTPTPPSVASAREHSQQRASSASEAELQSSLHHGTQFSQQSSSKEAEFATTYSSATSRMGSKKPDYSTYAFQPSSREQLQGGQQVQYSGSAAEANAQMTKGGAGASTRSNQLGTSIESSGEDSNEQMGNVRGGDYFTRIFYGPRANSPQFTRGSAGSSGNAAEHVRYRPPGVDYADQNVHLVSPVLGTAAGAGGPGVSQSSSKKRRKQRKRRQTGLLSGENTDNYSGEGGRPRGVSGPLGSTGAHGSASTSVPPDLRRLHQAGEEYHFTKKLETGKSPGQRLLDAVKYYTYWDVVTGKESGQKLLVAESPRKSGVPINPRGRKHGSSDSQKGPGGSSGSSKATPSSDVISHEEGTAEGSFVSPFKMLSKQLFDADKSTPGSTPNIQWGVGRPLETSMEIVAGGADPAKVGGAPSSAPSATVHILAPPSQGHNLDVAALETAGEGQGDAHFHPSRSSDRLTSSRPAPTTLSSNSQLQPISSSGGGVTSTTAGGTSTSSVPGSQRTNMLMLKPATGASPTTSEEDILHEAERSGVRINIGRESDLHAAVEAPLSVESLPDNYSVHVFESKPRSGHNTTAENCLERVNHAVRDAVGVRDGDVGGTQPQMIDGLKQRAYATAGAFQDATRPVVNGFMQHVQENFTRESVARLGRRTYKMGEKGYRSTKDFVRDTDFKSRGRDCYDNSKRSCCYELPSFLSRTANSFTTRAQTAW